MSEALYLEDSYLKEFDASVVSVDQGKFVVLDKTAFYPASGGQPHDEGVIKKNGEEFKVVFVGKVSGNISHEVDHEGLKPGDKVSCIIDWDRRYKFMRMHTAAHIISDLVHRKTGAKITGNQLDIDKSRIDFSLEDFNREAMSAYIDEANSIAQEGHVIKTYFLPRDEALKIPSMVKLAGALPPSIDKLRIVEIGDVDKQADGGTHVRDTSEIGEIELLRFDNKGKNNRRLYYKLNE